MRGIRGLLFWMASIMLAFVATAGVFLMLAELGTSQPGESLGADGESRASSGDPLSVELQRDSLESLEEAEGQTLGITLSNNSEREITGIKVHLILFSEDTADQDTRYYEAEVQELSPGGSKIVHFDNKLDFSPPKPGNNAEASQNGGSQDRESFNILEVRAASSEGVSTVKTAVLSF